MQDSGNAGQIDYWNDTPGQRWVTHDTELDNLHAPVAERLLERAGLKPGDRVLDIGCGAGATCVAAASRVGRDGGVFGVDVSSPLLLRAARRIEAHGLSNVELAQADAQSHPFKSESFDVVIARFGMMFFSDPVAAFRNVSEALRPGAPMVFAAWAGAEFNPWFSIPKQVTETRVGTAPPSLPGAPGPMAFSDAPRVIALLAAAGLSDVSAERTDLELVLPGGAAAAARLAVYVGPAARILRIKEATQSDRKDVVEALVHAFEDYGTADEFRIPASVYLFSARAAAPELESTKHA